MWGRDNGLSTYNDVCSSYGFLRVVLFSDFSGNEAVIVDAFQSEYDDDILQFAHGL